MLSFPKPAAQGKGTGEKQQPCSSSSHQLWLGKQEEMMLQGHPDSSLARQALTFFHHI